MNHVRVTVEARTRGAPSPALTLTLSGRPTDVVKALVDGLLTMGKASTPRQYVKLLAQTDQLLAASQDVLAPLERGADEEPPDEG